MATGTDPISIAMVQGISKALEYKAKKPMATVDEVLWHVMKILSMPEQLKVAAIAAASKALKYREKFPDERGKDIMQRVINEISHIKTDIKKHKK